MRRLVYRCLNIIPSIIVVISLIVIYVRRQFWSDAPPVPEAYQGLLQVWLIIFLASLFLVISLMVGYIVHLVLANKKMSFYKKLIWLFALWFLNVIAIAVYYFKFFDNPNRIEVIEH